MYVYCMCVCMYAGIHGTKEDACQNITTASDTPTPEALEAPYPLNPSCVSPLPLIEDRSEDDNLGRKRGPGFPGMELSFKGILGSRESRTAQGSPVRARTLAKTTPPQTLTRPKTKTPSGSARQRRRSNLKRRGIMIRALGLPPNSLALHSASKANDASTESVKPRRGPTLPQSYCPPTRPS